MQTGRRKHSAFCISSMSNLPDWADDLRRRYLRGEASIFVLHGNVFDAVLSGDRFLTLTDFLGNVLLKESKETIDSLSSTLRSEEHTSELQSRFDLVCRLLLEKKNKMITDAVRCYIST